jgi:uncharacterized membrane protein
MGYRGQELEHTADSARNLTAAGILLGLGLGGFFDGIVLHQILQWHHMLSNVDGSPMTTVRGLEENTLADGLFHAVTYVFTLAGIVFLWRSSLVGWTARAFIGLLIFGWGAFNVVEGVVDHFLLQVHHVREDVDNQIAWDLGFLAWGVIMLLVGWWMYRSGRPETH